MKIQTLQECTREHLERVLVKTGWDLEKAALLLRIPVARVRQKIEKLGLIPERTRFSSSPHHADKEIRDETKDS